MALTDSPQTFEKAAGAVLTECVDLATQRGGEYSDSWDLKAQVSTLTRATLSRFGVALEPEQIRLLLLAALADVKDSRVVAGGPFKRDSMTDAINYRAAYCSLREDYEKADARRKKAVVAVPGPDASTV